MKKAIALTLTLAMAVTMAVTMAGCGNNQKGTVTSASGKKISTDLIKGSIKLADYKGLEVYEDEIKVEETEVQSHKNCVSGHFLQDHMTEIMRS